MTCSAAMKACPMCDEAPKISGLWQFQVRCSCGACGPKMHTQLDAVNRWNSVVYFVRKFRAANVVPHDARYNALTC
jgi:hypothetical protein